MPLGIVLLGFMGAGKTTVGRALAARLNWPFTDLDSFIEARQSQSIRDLFLQRGEAAFRETESAALHEVITSMSSGAHVLALGGGTPMDPHNLEEIESSGLLTIYLNAAIDELWQRSRLEHTERPLRRDKARFRKMNEVRRPTYLRASVTIETTGKPVETVVEEILQYVRAARAKETANQTLSP